MTIKTVGHTPIVKQWRQAHTSNGQGLVYDEKTGKNIAVTYEETNACLIAAAPELLEALKIALGAIEYANKFSIEAPPVYYNALKTGRQAIAKAEGKE